MIAGPSIHFVGIGGIGMSGLAKVLIEAGYSVSGCDRQRSHITARLSELGATIYEGHSAAHVAGVDLLVISSAIPDDNADLVAAQRCEVPVVKRAELLGHLMKDRKGVAVAGTHGKTTTTGMIAWILEEAGLGPTIFAGGELVNLDTNAKRGQGPYVVAEADEYDYAFLELAPAVAVVTNIEADHPDIFEDLDAVIDTFAAFLDRVQPDGHVIACADDVHVQQLTAERGRVTTYGLTQPADWQAQDIKSNGRLQTFAVHHRAQSRGEFRIHLPGTHNVSNALAAIAAASTIGVDLEAARAALAGFRGTRRRFEEKGQVHDVIVIDDYAHHPTEIQATLAAARQRYGGRTLWAVFQPHTYSRTRALFDDFANSLTGADHVVITDIYAAREQDTLGIHSQDLVSRMRSEPAGGDYESLMHIASLEDAATHVADHLTPGDVLITLGAGDVWKAGERVLELLARTVTSEQ
ncbi:MAG: UDP-N-acetylmuramate--L-alanine ligase [Anaerolineales bacterium]|nr:UDP-N-acetylmuramate--L-alanine ligase [Anaerolineales bacterium]